MNKLFKRLATFLIFPIATLIIWISIYGFPPSYFSNSLSFNAKIDFLKKNYSNKKLDILFVGSSMSLNNINSQTVAKKLTDNFANVSSWGQNIEESYKLISILGEYYKPKTIVMSGNFMDFCISSKKVDFELIEDYLIKDKLLYLYGSNLNTFLHDTKEYNDFINKKNSYYNLNFDKHGSINIESKDLVVDSSRWIGNKISNYPFDENQYKYLDSLSAFCKKQNIKFVYLQSPFRNGYSEKLSENDIQKFKEHLNKISVILNVNNGTLIHSSNQNWPDSLFIDYSHLNVEGSSIYTAYLADKLDSLKLQ